RPALAGPMLRPSTPTRFPYTTLFRSELHGRRLGADDDPALRLLVEAEGGDAVLGAVEDGGLCGGRRAGQSGRESAQLPAVLLDQDRKSTRLNSSHVKISYAVICLKKK